MRKKLSLLHRYASVRKKLLNVEELHMYDLYVPMVAEADRHYTFEEAKSIVKEGLAPMGKEYLSLLQEGFDNRWIDVYENEGKRSGAYSWGVYGCHPYVLLNFHGTLMMYLHWLTKWVIPFIPGIPTRSSLIPTVAIKSLLQRWLLPVMRRF